MEKSESITHLVEALVLAQAEVKIVEKEANNPFFKSKYADLPAIQKEYQRVFPKHGLVVTQMPEGVGLRTTIAHKSGEWMSALATLLLTKNDPQGLGSAITYMRRYALASVCGIVSGDDDDDGNAASHPAKTEHMPSAAQKAPSRPVEREQEQGEPNTLIEKLATVKPTKSSMFFQLEFANTVRMGCTAGIAALANKALEADHKVSVEWIQDGPYKKCLTLVEVLPEESVPF